MNETLDTVSAAIQQFNRPPEGNSVPYERNANFMEVSIPYTELGGMQPEDVIRVGAVVAGKGYDPVSSR